MTRMQDWEAEIADARRHEGWSLHGPRRIVKVLPFGAGGMRTKGYIGVESALLGKTPHLIERALGLYTGSLQGGCSVYRLLRLPLASEVEYELTANRPGGQAFNPAMHSARYPPGSAAVHQWRLKVDLPVAHLIDLAPGAVYPYLHR